MNARRIGLVMILVGLVAAAGIAQDSGGDPVAAELAAVAAWEASPVFATPSTPPLRQPEAIVFFSDFEADNGGLAGNLDWEWGTSYAWVGSNCYNTSYNEPPGPYSGNGMWGTVLNNCYSDLGNNQGASSGGACSNTNPADDSILSLTVDLTNYSDATLSWYEWFDVFTYFDWAEVRINGSSALIYCASSYVAPTAWVLQSLDLTPYVGGSVTIEWHFMSSTVVNYAGWYIDDVLVDGTVVPVELQSIAIE